MTRHDHRIRNRGPEYYSSHHYEESREYQMEQKIEHFCFKLKYAFLWRLRRKKNGQD